MSDDTITIDNSTEGLDADEAALFEAMKSGKDIPVRTAADFPEEPEEEAEDAEEEDLDEEEAEEEEEDEEEGPRAKDPISGLKKALAAERAAKREILQRMQMGEQRLTQLMEAFQRQSQPQEEQAPDPLQTDPDEDIFTSVRGMQQELMRRRQEDMQRQQQTQAQQRAMEIGSWADREERAFMQKQPDYMDAVKHFDEHRAQELSLIGMTPQQISQVIAQDKIALVNRAIAMAQSGKPISPAELMYKMAKSRGYAGKQAQDETRLQEAPRKARSLSRTGGGARSQSISYAELGNMSQDAFDRLYAKVSGGQGVKSAAMRRILGG